MQLLKTKDPLIVSHTIRAVVSNSMKTVEKSPRSQSAERNDLDGDTLTASKAEDYMFAQKGRCEANVDEAMPLQCLSSSALNRRGMQGVQKGDSHGDELLTVSSDLPDRRTSSSAPGTPRTPTGNENTSSRALVGVPYHSQPLLGSSHSADDWPIRSPRSFKIRSQRARLGTNEDAAALAMTPTHKPRKPVTLPSRLLQTPATSGRLVRRPIDGRSRYYGTLPLVRTANVQSSTDGPESSPVSVVTVLGRAKTSPSVATQNDCRTLSPTFSRQRLSSLKAALLSPAESPRIWLHGTSFLRYIQPMVPSKAILQTDQTGANDSPSQNTEVDVRHNIAAAIHPTTVIYNEMLHVCFPSRMCSETYEIKVEVEVLLSNPDATGWRILTIPGLLTEGHREVRGRIQFSLVSHIEGCVKVPTVRFDPNGCVVPRRVQEKQLEGDFSINEPFALRLRLEGEVIDIKEWNSNVTVYSSVHCRKGRGLYMRSHVSLTVEPVMEEHLARRTVFSLHIRNGPPDGGIYRLEAGECFVELPAYEYTVTDFDRSVEIWIERDTRDMGKQLKFTFTCHHPNIQEASIVLPVIFPKLGKVLSETSWLLKPLPPLILEPIIREFLSTWKCSERSVGRRKVLCFDRLKMPSRYPNALSDDPCVRLRSLEPVSFYGLEDGFGQVEACSNIVPSLDISVDIVPGNRLECRLSFNLEVGTSQPLLKIEALEWVPMYSSINDHICTQEDPSWWEEDDNLCLFRAPWMCPGDSLRVEMAFTMIGRIDDLVTEKDQFISVNGTLPRITDKVILGGHLSCNIDNAMVTLFFNKDLSRDCEEIPFSTHYGENSKRLPLLRQGHRLELDFQRLNPNRRIRSKTTGRPVEADKIRFSGGFPLQPRTLRFEDEHKDTASSSSGDSDDEQSGSSSLCVQSTAQENGRSCGNKTESDQAAHLRSAGRLHSPMTDPQPAYMTKHKDTPGIGCGGSSEREKNDSLPTEEDQSRDQEIPGSGHHRTSHTKCQADSRVAKGEEEWIDSVIAVLDTRDGGITIGYSDDDRESDDGSEYAATNTDEEKSKASDDISVAASEGDWNESDVDEDDDDDSDFEDGEPLPWAHLVVRCFVAIVRYLGGRSPVQYFFRFLMLEFVCFWMRGAGPLPPSSSLGWSADVYCTSRDVVMGDLHLEERTLSEVVARDVYLVPGVGEQAEGVGEMNETEAKEGVVRGLRDRIDLALGWRPGGD